MALTATAAGTLKIKYPRDGTRARDQQRDDLLARFIRRYGAAIDRASTPATPEIQYRQLSRDDIEMFDAALFASGEFVYDIE